LEASSRSHPASGGSTIFTSNRSQAVRIPNAVASPDDGHQVDIVKVGRSRMIVPQGKRWDDLFQVARMSAMDFMTEREQPSALNASRSDADLYARYQYLHLCDEVLST
jgi:antitoxin VapB